MGSPYLCRQVYNDGSKSPSRSIPPVQVVPPVRVVALPHSAKWPRPGDCGGSQLRSTKVAETASGQRGHIVRLLSFARARALILFGKKRAAEIVRRSGSGHRAVKSQGIRCRASEIRKLTARRVMFQIDRTVASCALPQNKKYRYKGGPHDAGPLHWYYRSPPSFTPQAILIPFIHPSSRPNHPYFRP